MEHFDGTQISTSSTSDITIDGPGLAKVKFFKESTFEVQLSKVKIKSMGDGTYSIIKSNHIPYLDIAENGEVKFFFPEAETTHPSYTINHSDEENILHVTDSLGNIFVANSLGQIAVQTNKSKSNTENIIPPAFMPRFFFINSNATGFELHHNKVVQQILGNARKANDTFLIQESLSSNPTLKSDTLIKPQIDTSFDFNDEYFIPKNKLPQDDTLSSKEEKHSNRKFGINFARHSSEHVNSVNSLVPTFKTPTWLRYRQFIHIKPLHEVRDVVLRCITKFLTLKESQTSTVHQYDNQNSELRNQSVEQLLTTEAILLQDLSATYQEKWQLTHFPPQSPPSPRISKIPERTQEIMKAIQESKKVQKKIKTKDFPLYFNSVGKLPLILMRTNSNCLSDSLHHQNHSNDFGQPGITTPIFVPLDVDMDSGTELNSPLQSISPSKIRPNNPTPIHAEGDGSPTEVRPSNPTPYQAKSTNVKVSYFQKGHGYSATFKTTNENTTKQFEQQNINVSTGVVWI